MTKAKKIGILKLKTGSFLTMFLGIFCYPVVSVRMTYALFQLEVCPVLIGIIQRKDQHIAVTCHGLICLPVVNVLAA